VPNRRKSFVVATLVAAACSLAPRVWADDLVGYNALASRPGALLANGAGLPVAQVEAFAPGTTNYAPDTTSPDFAAKTFTLRSGPSGISPHANEVATYFYGATFSADRGAAPVALFSAESFVYDLLRTGRSRRAPGGAGAAVVNNSWIATLTDDATNIDAVRRLDDLINRDDLLVFNAVSNAATDPFPRLLASSFNGVSVGTLTGSHGPLTFDSPRPRIKPDLVIDTPMTSDASALAAGAGALLRSEARARGLPAGELATKAILMAGARRDAAWHRGGLSGRDNARSPLDLQQGAGQLRVDNSFDILTAGQQPAGTSVSPTAGWDYARTPRRKGRATYYLHVDHDLANWSVFLTWNRLIAGLNGKGHYSTQATLADFSLSLYRNRKGGKRLIGTSDSPGDNVESLTLTDLGPGDYQLVLGTDIRSYYAMAWYEEGASASPALTRALAARSDAFLTSSSDAFDAVAMPEPSAVGTLAVATLLCARRRKRLRG
jgi:hypothetical protein